MDSLTDGLDQLEAETNALVQAADQVSVEPAPADGPSNQALLAGIIESHDQMQRLVAQQKQSQQHFLDSLAAERMAGLKKIDNDRRMLQAQATVQRNKALNHWVWLTCGFVGLCSLAGAAYFVLLQPSIAKYQTYKADHEVLEAGSVFGARVTEHEGKTLVVFDKNVEAENCGAGYLPNCVWIKK